MPPKTTLDDIQLEDRFERDSERLLLTGDQVLARILLTQSWLDHDRGLKTGGFVSGYRGSPLGGLDRELTAAAMAFKAANIVFQPGVNEELAATAIWGSQQIGLSPGARFDGVFGLWYGKGPGVDRSGDAFKHANLAGTAPLGGVLAVAGDDHRGASSTTAHQSEFAFMDAQIPVFAPSDLQDVLDFGVAGIALSRASGCWVGLKCPSDVIEQAASIKTGLSRFIFPTPPECTDDLHIRWPDPALAQERRLAGPKMAMVRAATHALGLDRQMGAKDHRRIGIIAAGKPWGNTLDALELLGIDEAALQKMGIALFKPALVWPLEPTKIREFSKGLEEIIVVEEKRPLIEPQLRDILYDLPASVRPRIMGKSNTPLFPLAGPIDARLIAHGIHERLAALDINPPNTPPELPALAKPALRRPPHFCSGCPHNISTRVPEGHRALAGIGCHTLALWSDPNTQTLTQMGGEGTSWIGQAPFTDTEHVFANIGDGTYYHSGLLAIRAALTSGVNITYKILYNDAVAMTGGQKVEGGLSVAEIARELDAEGVKHITVIAEEPGQYKKSDPLPDGTTLLGRDGFECAQLELAASPGVSVLIFDQTCAAEKRRRRRRGEMEEPTRLVFINERACEGCGDCQKASHCLSVVPVATPFGEKRRIDHGSCNKDESCLNGFCPAMVTVEGAQPKTTPYGPDHVEIPNHLVDLPLPKAPEGQNAWRILITGIGGTGVVTIGHLIAMAAHMEGKQANVMDQTGLAQKGGSVTSHVTIGLNTGLTGAGRIGAAMADVVLGCDLVVAADTPQAATMAHGRTRAVINTEHAITGAFLRDPEKAFPQTPLLDALRTQIGPDALTLTDATRMALRLTGKAITANMFILGLAWQQGLIPVSEAAIHRAIILNGVDAKTNTEAFTWGRRASIDPDAVTTLAGLEADLDTAPQTEDGVSLRLETLRQYSGDGLANTYRTRLDAIAMVIQDRVPDVAAQNKLKTAIMDAYFRVLAPKDEYEIARLYTDGVFDAALKKNFEGDFQVHYHMAPAGLSPIDPITIHARKRHFGPWLKICLRALAMAKGLRGTWFDPFQWTSERRLERATRTAYERDLERIQSILAPHNFDLCLELARLPIALRGFGHIKMGAQIQIETRRKELIALLENGKSGQIAAE
ncbi:MAG: indolepyruvate ferredoxin oxidoreductase family protein [Rhodospirillales bacterium]|nr:indolepyruvate ferredoxin oxidoreductase family protein [Rhodospirillales bacterium]MBT4006471.1 indolepyruvate ferredoxin oxidoreductase family protein [Rhodospirillales bacterium]MBT5113749.1 indolepyruvate ferredoxin oxidoreductase family protein [Rhodospirillales bacterium]MBT6187048.1 indolepyruvate ferredoxin oxidoreductase family protein [Rhodospirillales bacterium]MBT6741870.1 indolepyruvate ferredoxin oxidoreductase family protein [Rhodospirillales bacterium]